jgi:hypothetical protein
MARVLVVANEFTARRTIDSALTPLRTLGIDAVPARISGNTLALVGQTFTDAGAQQVRDYINANFDAVLIVDRSAISSTGTFLTRPLNVWTTWNEPDDKPVAFLGPNLSTAVTGYNLPADFPLIRPNPTDLSNTTHLLDANTFVVPPGVPLPVYARLGTRVRLNREQVSVYTPAVCAFAGNDAYFWKLDIPKHTALGANGEILAVPDFPDRTYPEDAVIAYRYKNRYFFPLIWETGGTLRGDTSSTVGVSLFWLVYALKCMGIQPSRQAILCIEFDHPIVTRDPRNRVDNLTKPQQYTILHRTYEWLADFCEQTGLVIPCGVTNGSWVGRGAGYHWDEVRDPAARAIHDLLIRESAVLPCGVHDHSYTWGRDSGPFRRAGNHAHRFAAPNDVPVEYGQSGQGWVLVNPKVAPEELRTNPSLPRTLDGFINIGAQTSGTGTLTTSTTNLCEYTAQMVLADEFAEMQALGFADGHCGRQRYTNCAGDQTGGEGYWKALIAFGFRGVRRTLLKQMANEGNPVTSRWQVHPGLGRRSRYRGLHFVYSTQIDWNASTPPDGSYGLYRSDREGNTVVGYWKLDAGRDATPPEPEFTEETWNDAAVRWKAYRRAMGLMVGLWLGFALYWRGTVYQHPPSWFGADPANPTDVVDTGTDLKVNAIVEILKAMRDVQQVLSAYLRFGSPSDVMDLREEVGA